MSGSWVSVLVALALLAVFVLPVGAVQTTTLEVVRYGWDNTTIEESVTVNVTWMESHLPVMGDGVTPYAFQGPTFDPTDLWNPDEDLNIAKINETVKGTALCDLVDLVGGMHPGDEVQLRAADGFRKRLNYTNLYEPQARQGAPILAWWNARYGYNWSSAMRLFFMADTSSNPDHLHVFGNEDMRQCLSPAYWHFFNSDGIDYPSASGLSVGTVARLEVYPAPRAIAVPPQTVAPRDLDGDGKYEDVNGNGRKDFADVTLYFNQMTWIGTNEPIGFFDYNNNGRIDFADVVVLFKAL
jgi:PKD repeat protein